MSKKTIKVIAVATGFHLGLRQEGDVFEVPEELLSSDAWFKRYEEEQAAPVAASTPTGGTQGSGGSDPDDKPPVYSRMNKAELTLEAAKAGIDLTGSETNAQIIELLTAKNSQK